MNHATDFARLYAELGISPPCTLEVFKRAYRRRVAELHPDRPSTAARDPARLIALNVGYAAVLDFHREHGRLPGEPPPGTSATRAAAPRRGGSRGMPAGGPPAATSPAVRAPGSASRRAVWMRTLLTLLVVAGASWHWLPASGERAAPSLDAPAAAPPADVSARVRLQPGMDRRTVTALLGEPVARDASDSHWVYGPSWVYFECGRLSDWYSAPLYPLPVATQRPQPEAKGAAGRAAAAPPRACPDHALARTAVAPQAHGDD
ncbi:MULTISPECIES: hypothetical protein [unclassified Luteimonas]|uniref:hypothetical protein n=1 Tax=unclassified Luteimonas TaxID=2629088 RepID=UPI0015FF5687|nr:MULTISPECIES: hypothetical protein [unclassified Luteimonas]MBB1472365.1 hypothetical protein [Luteimonas sp. MC1782]MBB6598918.1 hypothetical protein [Luteimonas sp. MC1825]QOC89062.1 hypothetical protein IDM46_04860 [Luteimonas sp. MC1825]